MGWRWVGAAPGPHYSTALSPSAFKQKVLSSGSFAQETSLQKISKKLLTVSPLDKPSRDDPSSFFLQNI